MAGYLAPLSNKEKPGNAPAQVIAFLSDDESLKTVNRTLDQLGIEQSLVRLGGLEIALKSIERGQRFKILIVDLTGTRLEATQISELMELCPPSTQIIGVGDQDTVSFYRQVRNLGFRDYLVKPLPDHVLQATLQNLNNRQATGHDHQRVARRISLMGISGGVGTSLIAAGVAHSISKIRGRKCLLLDCNGNRGSLSVQFGAQENNGLGELLRSPDRIDELLLKRQLRKLGPQLDLLASDTYSVQQLIEWSVGLPTVLKYGEADYHYIVQDQAFPLKSEETGPTNRLQLIVTDRRLSSLRSLKLLLSQQGEWDVNRIILNNPRPISKSDIADEEVAEFLGRKPDFSIPYDAKKVGRHELAFEPVTMSRNPVSLKLYEVVRSITGGSLTAPAKGAGWIQLVRRRALVR